MNIIIYLINLLILIGFILSVLNAIRRIFGFIRNLVSTSPEKFELTNKELIYFGISLSVIIAVLIKGFTVC